MNALIIGSTTGIGRSLAEKFAAAGYNLFLIASGSHDLLAQTADLKYRFNIVADCLAFDLTNDNMDIIYESYHNVFNSIHLLCSVAGYGEPNSDTGIVNKKLANTLINVNYSSHVKIINLFIDDLLRTEKSVCCGIGSAAAVCPKPYNIIYSASKKGLEYYFSCLMMRYSSEECKFQFYRMGFVKTSLFRKYNFFIPAVSADYVADKIISLMKKKSGIYHVPVWWAPLLQICKIFRKVIFSRIH